MKKKWIYLIQDLKIMIQKLIDHQFQIIKIMIIKEKINKKM